MQLRKYKVPIVFGVIIALLLIAGVVYMTTMYLNVNKKSTPTKSAQPALVAPKTVQNSLQSASDAGQNAAKQQSASTDAFNEQQVKVAQ